MTSINVSLSATLQSTLAKEGVWAYVFYFDTDGAHYERLVTNGAVDNAGKVAIDVETVIGGKYYFLIQSQASSNPNDLSKLITAQSDIDWPHSVDWDFRFDSFEVTLSGQPADAGNLTSVNGFGLPMGVTVDYGGSDTASLGYKVSGDTLFKEFSGIGHQDPVHTYGSGPLASEDRYALSPSEALGQNPVIPAFEAHDWAAYVESFLSDKAGDIRVAGFFNGAPEGGVYHNAGFYSYTLEADVAAKAFWLTPDPTSEIKGYIRITAEALENSIYSTLGNVGVFASKTDKDPYQILDHADLDPGLTMNTGENNQWGEVLTQILTGFSAAFYGNEGKSASGDTVDLNKSWNWDPTYAFGANLEAAAKFGGDPYAKILFENSNSYGSSYTDNLMRQYDEGGPLISVAKPGGGNVDTIDIVIYDDGETPQGYTTPVIHNYIAPKPKYETVTGAGDTSITLNFQNQNMVLVGDTPVSLEVLTSYDNETAVFTTIDFTLKKGETLWHDWTITKSGSTYSATASAAASPAGEMVISNLPAGAAGTYWYRINVGEGATKKVFNLYTELSGKTGDLAFVNPVETAGSVAIEGQATISTDPSVTTPTIESLTLNMLYGATSTVDSDLLTRGSGAAQSGMATAPVAGTIEGGAFKALPGQTSLKTNEIHTGEAKLAFAWTGLNDAPDTRSWIGGPTNKIGALDYAVVSVREHGKLVGAPVTGKADLDGQWHTGDLAKALGNGTYEVTMREHTAANASEASAQGGDSHALQVTVALAKAGLAVSADGQGLALEEGTDASANWVSFETVSSTVPRGSTVLVYAVDADGALVSREGVHGADVSLADAVRGTVGAVHADDQHVLLGGMQSLYLDADLSLRFAIASGSGDVDLAPTVAATARADGSVLLDVGGIGFEVVTDNDLSAEAILAGPQRETNEALIYLEEGHAIDVEIAGSSAHTNTLGFVRLDIDPFSGQWSVDGVAYGDSDAFREAVRANLAGDFLMEGGGRDFADEGTFVVDGPDGYYAPVLLTQTGNVFVVGEGNEGGHSYIRLFGENTFGFEDLAADENSDFDYNDMVMRISPADLELAI